MHVKRALVPIVAAAALLGLMAGPAGADPVNAKNGEILVINCAGLGTLTVALNGNGAVTPGHVTTSTQVGMPYELHVLGTFTPNSGPNAGIPQPIVDNTVKNAPRNGRLDTCTFSQSGPVPGGFVSIIGSVKISYTPAH